ncbi:MAG: hypothetical protein LQ342_001922 [Letrouitia transgressa]|nr:MAG: hypothetical protein LQ342_001922 [Letrouitia transgressa]
MPHQHHAKHQHLRARNLHLKPRQQPETVVQVVYKTAAKTFDGPIGGYMTLDGSQNNNNANANANQNAPAPARPTPVAQSPPEDPSPEPAPPIEAPETPVVDTDPSPTPPPRAKATPIQQAPPAETPTPSSAANEAPANTPKLKATPSTTSSSSKARATKNAKQSPVDSDLESSQVQASPTQDLLSGTSGSIGSASASSSASSAPTSSSGGMSGGAKAGLAIGILLCIGLLVALGLFCYRRKKRHQDAYTKTDDEKTESAPSAAAVARAPSTQSRRTAATAPRLSLRPVTEFLPNLPGNRKSGNLLAPGGNMTEKGAVPNQANNPANPFGNHAEPSEKAMAPREEKAMVPNNANNAANPFGNHAETIEQPAEADRSGPVDGAMPAPLRVRTPTPDGSASSASATALAAAGLAGPAKSAPKPLNLSPNRSASPGPIPSPAGTEFSMNSVGTGVMANGPPPSNVHRVQLDFKPSMDDELALRAGQLVRLLHEYDDGWALCIRLDRSQQGVAPRTCLSARPVKPRPNPNARPPPRGPPPPGMFGPGQQRPMSPNNGPYDRAPRGMGPGPHPVQRSMSPGPYGGGPQQRPNMPHPATKRRSNSASDVRERRNSPPGPSPMNPNARNIMTGMQKVPMQLQAVTSPDQAVPMSTSPPASVPARKPVPGQAM